METYLERIQEIETALDNETDPIKRYYYRQCLKSLLQRLESMKSA